MSGVTEYLDSKRIDYKLKGKEAILTCPTCNKEKLSINIDTEVYQCWYCQAINPTSIAAKGHISQLKELLGDVIPIMSIVPPKPKEESKQIDFTALVEGYHKSIWEQPRALKYLIKMRRFTEDIIREEKLGYAVKFKHEWISIPVYEKGVPVLIKFRQIPPENEKLDKYVREEGGKSALYNGDIIEQYDEIFVTEGEFDAMALKHHGFPNVVGMTVGASSLLSEWYDRLVLKNKIYLVLDPDLVGQNCAKNTWATRLGLGKCWNVTIPLNTNGGKEDVNSFFVNHTREDFNQLVLRAERFPVEGLVSLEDVFQEMYDKSKEGEREAFPTPWPTLNRFIGGGLQRGELVVIGAPAGVGKTTMAVQMLHYLAKNNNVPSFLMCLEMTKIQLATKVVQVAYELPFEEVDYSAALVYAEGLRNLPLYLGYSPGISMKTFIETCKVARDRFGCGVVCLDNLQFMIRSKEESDYGTATRDLKNLALKLNITVLLISQPRKMKTGEEFTYDDLKGSSAISQDADTVILVNRKRTRQNKVAGSFSGMADIIIDKSRFSSGGSFNMSFEGNMSRFREENQ